MAGDEGARPHKKRSGEFLTPDAARRYSAPQTLAQWHDKFPDEASCRKYLATLRWPNGFLCPHCHAHGQAEANRAGLLRCCRCEAVCSPASATMLQDSPLPLRLWLRGIWEVVSSDAATNVSALARLLPMARRQLVRAWLGELREIFDEATSRPLHGVVEVAKVPVSVARRANRSRAAAGHAMVAVAAEALGHGVIGRARLQRLARVDGASMLAFVRHTVAARSCVRTAGWHGYSRLRRQGYGHIVAVGRAAAAEDAMRHAQRLASMLRVWLWSSEALTEDRLDYFLAEFNFRFNARLAHPTGDRGALFDAVLRHAIAPPSEARKRYASC